ncbi:MAG: LTA synthase family protein [Negativicutes bacterium]
MNFEKIRAALPHWLVCYVIIGIMLKSALVTMITFTPVVDWEAIQKTGELLLQYWQFYFAFSLVLVSFAYLLRNWRRPLFLLLLYLLISIVLLMDAIYFRGFKTMPSVHSLGQTAGAESLFDVTISLLRAVDIFFVLDFPIILTLVFRRRSNLRRFRFSWKSFLLAQLIVIVLLTSQFIAVKYELYGKYHFIIFPWDNNVTARNISPGGFHLYSLYTYWRDSQPMILSELEKNDIYKWLEENAEILPKNNRWATYRGKNLILIQFESLENFVINQEFDGQEITPNLNRMAAHGYYFNNFYEQVNEGNSSDAEFMANSSVYPLRQGSTFFRFPNNDYNTLPNLLKRHGYSATAFQSDDGSMWNVRPAFAAMGFEKFITVSEYNMNESFGMGFADGPYLQQTAEKLSKFTEPFYAFIVTMSSHGPFDIPEKYRELKLPPSLEKSKMGDYLQSINYSDRMLGNFLNALQRYDLLDNSIIAVYGDHEGVHRYYEDGIANVQPERDWWKNNGKRVPFIIYQEAKVGERITITGGEIDVMPTLAYLLGIPAEEYAHSTVGRNLLNTKEDFAVLANRQVVGGNITEQLKQRVLKGLEVADTAIKSNYFLNFLR